MCRGVPTKEDVSESRVRLLEFFYQPEDEPMEMTDKSRRRTNLTLVAAAAALLYVGCGPTGGNQPVDHETTQQHLEQSSSTLADRVGNSADFVESSELLSYSYGTTYGEDCTNTSDGSTTCERNTDPEFNIAENVKDSVERVLTELQKRVFKRDNIVSESRTSVTYAIEGEDFCEETYETCEYGPDGNKQNCTEEPNDNYGQCKQNMNAMNTRIRVTRPQGNDYRFTLLVSSNDYQPVSVTLGNSKIAATGDLGDIKRTIKHSDEVYDNDTSEELPATMKGKLRGELRSDREKHAHFEVKIEQAVNVSGNDYDVALAKAAKPVFGVTADGQAKKITSTLNFNNIEASWPVEHYKNDSSKPRSKQKSKTLEYAVNLAGATIKSTYEAGSDQLEFTNIGLGDATSWLKIAGKKAVTADVNPNDGRSFGVTIGVHKNNDGSTEAWTFDVKPALDVTADFDFTHVDSWLYVDDYLENYTFSALLDGATPASLRLNDEHLEVTAGTLELSSKNPTAKRTANSGQCIEYVESGTDMEMYHLLRDLEATDCTSN